MDAAARRFARYTLAAALRESPESARARAVAAAFVQAAALMRERRSFGSVAESDAYYFWLLDEAAAGASEAEKVPARRWRVDITAREVEENLEAPAAGGRFALQRLAAPPRPYLISRVSCPACGSHSVEAESVMEATRADEGFKLRYRCAACNKKFESF